MTPPDPAPRRSAEHGFTPVRRTAEHGFTLVEVMVALLIFGMIAAGGVAILSFGVRAQGATGRRLDRLGALERTLSIVSADCAQAVERPARDEVGTLMPAFVGGHGDGGGPLLTLVRGGWNSVDAAPRSALQKVAYRVDGDVLVRVGYPMVDGAAPLPATTLIEGIRQVSLRYRYRGAWSDRWDGAGGVALPQAVEMIVIRRDGVTWRQLFVVGTGYAPQEVPGVAR